MRLTSRILPETRRQPRGAWLRRATHVLACLALWSSGSNVAEASAAGALRIGKAGTEKAYFTYRGEPLLSFGGLSDFMFWFADDAHDFRRWADWAAAHGMNHIRAYPPLSWKNLLRYTRRNQGDAANVLFPFRLVDGSLAEGDPQFDLNEFDQHYWQNFRERLEYLEAKGIIVHLLMWNNWQLRDDDTETDHATNDWDWDAHFFNPVNNVNGFTDHLKSANRTDLFHSAADGRKQLVRAQQAWFVKLIETISDFGNVYYDLVHELAEHQGDWKKTKVWIDAMTGAIGRAWNDQAPGRPLIMGMDTGGLSASQRSWIFSRPYFDVLIYGKSHNVRNARGWRIRYDKPYIGQEAWDDDGNKYTYGDPAHRVHLRKYFWKFMMAKCQQMDVYTWLPGDDPRTFQYDPQEHSAFEEDALVLRSLWDDLIDYPNLWFGGRLTASLPQGLHHEYLLSSSREALAYFSSATGVVNEEFSASIVKITNSRLDDGDYTVDLIKPDKHRGDGLLARWKNVVVADGSVILRLPDFTDDLAIHIY
jgi:hypothetical protein